MLSQRDFEWLIEEYGGQIDTVNNLERKFGELLNVARKGDPTLKKRALELSVATSEMWQCFERVKREMYLISDDR